jgi:hypothetical protein
LPLVLFVFVLCLVFPMLPVSLDCPFLIASETGNIGYTRHRTKANKTRGNQEWTIQRNWQHRVHKTQGEDKQNKGQSRMDNPEKLATLGTQDTGRRQTKQRWCLIRRRNCLLCTST